MNESGEAVNVEDLKPLDDKDSIGKLQTYFTDPTDYWGKGIINQIDAVLAETGESIRNEEGE